MELRAKGTKEGGLQSSALMQWAVVYTPVYSPVVFPRPIRYCVEGPGETVYGDDWLTAHGYQKVQFDYPDFRPRNARYVFPSRRTHAVYHRRTTIVYGRSLGDPQGLLSSHPEASGQGASDGPPGQKRQNSQSSETNSAEAQSKIGRSDSDASSARGGIRPQDGDPKGHDKQHDPVGTGPSPLPLAAAGWPGNAVPAPQVVRTFPFKNRPPYVPQGQGAPAGVQLGFPSPLQALHPCIWTIGTAVPTAPAEVSPRRGAAGLGLWCSFC